LSNCSERQPTLEKWEEVVRMNILIIDDEEIVLHTLERYIEYRGDTPLVALHGRAGLDILDEQAVDLVITDVNMPDMDGLEVLQAVSQKNPDIPVIIITAYADTDMAIRAVNQGAFAFLQKPLLADSLGEKIDDALLAIETRQNERTVVESLKQTGRRAAPTTSQGASL
jgi:DNA-binding NtrC family response regulator